ncbi:MAG: hypothetical protein RL180_1239 [Pseudomonadota bacterium]|jgi:alpha-ketoglutarate-dependent taurine dioxygenase
MSMTQHTCPSQLNADSSHAFITIYTPVDGCDPASLPSILQQHRDYFIQQIAARGVLLFRGFTPASASAETFHHVVTQGMGMTPWNSFNNNNMPAFMASLMRKYSENLLGAGDYRRYLDKNTVQLGPVEQSIQGPHVEGGVRAERSRYIVLCCFEPAPYLAETGMVDLHRVYRELPEATQRKYRQARNRFYYISARKTNPIDAMLLKKSPFTMIKRPDGYAHLALPPCPFVCRVPETGDLCLQPWAFAKNTNLISLAAAEANFTGRGTLQPDSTANGMNMTWELCDANGESIAWSEAEQRAMFDSIYQKAHLMNWHKGDIAFVDNIRIGHWRMNGEQGNRKLVQIQTDVFDANQHAADRVA